MKKALVLSLILSFGVSSYAKTLCSILTKNGPVVEGGEVKFNSMIDSDGNKKEGNYAIIGITKENKMVSLQNVDSLEEVKKSKKLDIAIVISKDAIENSDVGGNTISIVKVKAEHSRAEDLIRSEDSTGASGSLSFNTGIGLFDAALGVAIQCVNQ